MGRRGPLPLGPEDSSQGSAAGRSGLPKRGTVYGKSASVKSHPTRALPRLQGAAIGKPRPAEALAADVHPALRPGGESTKVWPAASLREKEMQRPRMTVLAIETSSSRGGLAVLGGEGREGEISFPEGLVHAREIAGRLEELLRQSGLRPRDLRGIAVSAGPGSFTGLRVGITAAKTLGLALGIPVVGESSLAVLAANAIFSPPDGREGAAAASGRALVPVATGGRDFVYGAAFLPAAGRGAGAAAEPRIERLLEDGAYAPEEFARRVADLLSGSSLEAWAFGDAAERLLGLFGAAPEGSSLPAARSRVARGPREWDFPRALVLGRLCARRLEAEPFERETIHRLEPAYARPSDAEIRHGKR